MCLSAVLRIQELLPNLCYSRKYLRHYFRAGADAKTHAEAQHNGELSNMSAHYYVDDGDTAYQAAPHSRGCWHVGINYGNGNLFGTYGNRNSIGVEMCVQGGYNYEKAFQHTVELVKYLMKETGIPASRVYRHLDICSKNCPSQINARGDWTRFKKLIRNGSGNVSEEKTYKPGIYRVNTDLNIREKPDADSRIVGMITDQGSYTVTKIQNTSWGRLLSGAGWINCHSKFCTYGGAAKESTSKAITVDGVWGHELTKRLQEIFKTGVDGVISYPSAMVKALQEWCNRQ